MSMTTLFREQTGVAGAVLSAAGVVSNTPYLTAAVDIKSSVGRKFVAVVNVGVIGSSGTVDGAFYWSATSGGSYSAIGSASLVQDTAGSKIHTVEVSTDKVVATYPTAKWLKFGVSIGTANTPVGAVVLSTDGGYLPTTDASALGGQNVYFV
jgi:hypothetical protein